MKYLFLILLTSCCLWQCSDIIVPDISAEKVLLRAPQDSSQLLGSSVTLSWEYLPDAVDYRLEIARPNFENLQTLVIDSVTAERNLTVALPSGSYAWRVVAFNEAYASDCCHEWTFQLQSDSSADLRNQTLLLLAPNDNTGINTNEVTLRWSPLAAATGYRLQLSESTTFSTLVLDSTTLATELVLDDLPEDSYFWRVRAENELSNSFTDYATRSFTIDFTQPSIPLLELPAENDTLVFTAQNPDFSWTSSEDNTTDTLYIYTDSFLDTLLLKTTSITERADLDAQSSDFLSGDYFWNVRSVDLAGNVSDLSITRMFIIE